MNRREAQVHRQRTKLGRFARTDWSAEDEARFVAMFPHASNRKLGVIFGLAEQTVASWGCERGLKKAQGGTGRAVPIGTENIDNKGYTVVKVAEGGGGKAWQRKHVLIWEAANGDIPDGYRLIFKDGNNRNCTLENLALITHADHLARHSIANYPTPIKQTMIALSKLKKAISEKQD